MRRYVCRATWPRCASTTPCKAGHWPDWAAAGVCATLVVRIGDAQNTFEVPGERAVFLCAKAQRAAALLPRRLAVALSEELPQMLDKTRHLRRQVQALQIHRIDVRRRRVVIAQHLHQAPAAQVIGQVPLGP